MGIEEISSFYANVHFVKNLYFEFDGANVFAEKVIECFRNSESRGRVCAVLTTMKVSGVNL